jgi:hypothetical protein
MQKTEDGAADAAAWLAAQPPDVTCMVRAALRAEPTPKALRRALYRAILATGDELTRTVADRCEDRGYAQAFGKAVLRGG